MANDVTSLNNQQETDPGIGSLPGVPQGGPAYGSQLPSGASSRNGSPAMSPLEQQKAQLLSQLNDIKTPAEVGVWPPAIGWWLLAALIISGLVYGANRIIKHHKSSLYRKQALAKLDQIKNDARSALNNVDNSNASAESDNAASRLQTNTLNDAMKTLKQCLFTAYPEARRYAGGLHGAEFLSLLDITCEKTTFIKFDEFTRNALYAHSPEVDEQQLFAFLQEARIWTMKHKRLDSHAFKTLLQNQYGPRFTISAEQLSNSRDGGSVYASV